MTDPNGNTLSEEEMEQIRGILGAEADNYIRPWEDD
jgi:hypothetical protein